MRKKRRIDFERYSEVFKALGHPLRLRLVACLCSNECNVNKLVVKLGIPQSRISQHLAILRNKGILIPRVDGTSRCYRIADDLVQEIVNVLLKPN